MPCGRRTAALLGALMLSPTLVAAQHAAVDRGTLLLGGGAGVSGWQEDGSDQGRFTISLAPSVGIFVARGLAVGGFASFGYSKIGSTNLHTWGIGPAMTYYFPLLGGFAYPFVDVETSFNWNSSHSTGVYPGDVVVVADRSGTAVQLRPSAGLLFMVVSHVGIRGELYLARSWTTSEIDVTGQPTTSTEVNTTTYGLAFGVTAFVF
jgi:hypothetical protein